MNITYKIIQQLTILILLLMNAKTSIQAQEISLEQGNDFIQFFKNQYSIPDEYNFVKAQKVKVDGKIAYLFRYEKTIKNVPTTEHFSFIIAEYPMKILGFTWMDRQFSEGKMLSKEQTQTIAKAFLQKIDTDLAQELENLWIAPHDESIWVEGKKVMVSGMKYKCYRPSHNDYAWVIVGANGKIITFERDILWNNSEHCRITEKWLHDEWIQQSKK